MIGARLRIACAAVVAAATVAGTLLDRAPERPVTTRAGWRVLEVDLHAHTRFADGLLSPFDLVIQARRRGLDALAITDHNILFPARMGRWYSRTFGGPTILLGEEITARDYHVHGVGLTERIDALLTKLDVDDVRALTEAGAQIRQWVMDAEFSPELDAAIRQAFAELSAGNDNLAVAVRSSGVRALVPTGAAVVVVALLRLWPPISSGVFSGEYLPSAASLGMSPLR